MLSVSGAPRAKLANMTNRVQLDGGSPNRKATANSNAQGIGRDRNCWLYRFIHLVVRLEEDIDVL